jgi:UDP-3-O-[3-hydroxymyristoyl] glucosamine N-acyltransferase
MTHPPDFFPRSAGLSLEAIAQLARASMPEGADPQRLFSGIAALEQADFTDISYMDNPAYTAQLEQTRAGLCLVSPRYADKVPAATLKLVVPQPYRLFAQLSAQIFPSAMRPHSQFEASGISPGAIIHPLARLEQGVIVDPGAVIGPHAEIGSGTIIGAQSVIGPHVKIGRDGAIASHVSVSHAFLGNRVILHSGVRVGQDGFGFAMGPQGHLKVPQIGRVIIQDDVEIGANSTIDRGASRDTVIGEGTKIDNLVQIAHNVVIGRHCVIVAQVGISGSTTLEDFVVIGGQVGIVGHVRIGMGAQIAASSAVNSDIPAGEKWGGIPAKPVRDWFREITTLKRLASRTNIAKDTPSET